MTTFNGLDYAIFVLLFLSVAIGMARGFVKEIISLIAWVAAFFIATVYAIKFASLFSGAGGQPPSANPLESVSMIAIVISYLVLFFGVLICGSLAKLIVNYAVEGGGLSMTNRFLGAVFGLSRGCVIVLIMLFFFTFTALTSHSLWKDSKLVPVFNPGVKWLNHIAQPYISQIEAKMKKKAKNLNQEDLSDIIKPKPATPAPTPEASTPTPVETAPAPTTPEASTPKPEAAAPIKTAP